MILFLLLAILPIDPIVREHFDTVEVNGFYSWHANTAENGDITYDLRPTFAQLLFRRWNEKQSTHLIQAWRMYDKNKISVRYVEAVGKYEIRFLDGQTERVVTTGSLVYSNSDFDPELEERAVLAKEYRVDLLRRELRNPKTLGRR